MVRRDRNKYECELGRRSAAKLLSKDEARRIAVNCVSESAHKRRQRDVAAPAEGGPPTLHQS
jgi:hypothetical protein